MTSHFLQEGESFAGTGPTEDPGVLAFESRGGDEEMLEFVPEALREFYHLGTDRASSQLASEWSRDRLASDSEKGTSLATARPWRQATLI